MFVYDNSNYDLHISLIIKGLYSTVSSWRVGLLALSLNGGVFRWSNGKTFKSDYWNDEALGVEGPVVTVLSSNFTLWYAKSAVNDNTRFICEKANGKLLKQQQQQKTFKKCQSILLLPM
jgi:hypothetical protein